MNFNEKNFKEAIEKRDVKYFRKFLDYTIETLWRPEHDTGRSWPCYSLVEELRKTRSEELTDSQIVILFERVRHAMHSTNSFLNAVFDDMFSLKFLNGLTK